MSRHSLTLTLFVSLTAVACSGEEGGPASGGAGGSSATGGVSSDAGGAPSGTGGVNSGSGGTSSGSGGDLTSAGGSPSGGSGGDGSGGDGSGGDGSGGDGSGGDGSGGDTSAPDAVAVAVIESTDGGNLSGTATFTQWGDQVTLVVELENCAGVHGTHLHANKSCANGGNAAGGHWVPEGEQIGDITCSGGSTTHEVTQPTSVWSIGDGGSQDVTVRSIMVHEGPTGARIGCGLVDLVE